MLLIFMELWNLVINFTKCRVFLVEKSFADIPVMIASFSEGMAEPALECPQNNLTTFVLYGLDKWNVILIAGD